MAQFDVFRLAGGRLVVDCQADLLSDLNTRLVIPLQPLAEGGQISERLNPILTIDDQGLVLKTHLAASIDAQLLGKAVSSVASQEYAVKSAIDMLLSGF